MQFLATLTQQQHLPFQESSSSQRQTEWDPPTEPQIRFPARPAAPPAAPPAVESPPEPETLLEAYQKRLKAKRQRTANAGTIGDHETSMKAFDEFCTVRNRTLSEANRLHRFYTPVQAMAETDLLRTFAEHLISGGMAPTTVSRRLTHMAMILKELKVETDKPTPDEVKRLHREITGEQPPPDPANQTESPAMEIDDRRIPSFSEIDAMARHVGNVTYPYGDHAPYFWRGWIRFLAYIGPRSRDVVSVLPRKTGLRKSDVIFETRCPIADVNNALGHELHSPHGWLWYTIGKDHHSDCRRILFPMPKWMRDWLRFFCEFSHSVDRVFPSCQPRSKALSQDCMSAAWNSIVNAAGADPRLVPSEGTGGRIALRKYASNWWHLATLRTKSDSSLADKMSHYVLHHAEVTTANKHYLNVQAAVLPTMLELMPTWPVPAADAPPVSLLPE